MGATRRSRVDAYKEIGATLDGRFRIQGLLGTGSTGDVFRAVRQEDGRAVALKVFAPALSHDERQMRRFRREVAVAGQLHHPNTVRVLEYGAFLDGRLFIAMECLEGETLGVTLRRGGPLPVARACAVARQVAEALSEAHALGIVHRDLKPDNVFLARVGRAVDFVKLLDFGIARFVGEDPADGTLTRTGFIAGTPLYISPEQGRNKPLDGRSDLYSLGVVLYEMVVGQPPFRADSPTELLLKHVHAPPPPPSKLNRGARLPGALLDLLSALLAKSPDDRPDDAREVARRLERVEHHSERARVGPARRRGGRRAGGRDRMARLHALPLPPEREGGEDVAPGVRELSALLREAFPPRPRAKSRSERRPTAPGGACEVEVAPVGRGVADAPAALSAASAAPADAHEPRSRAESAPTVPALRPPPPVRVAPTAASDEAPLLFVLLGLTAAATVVAYLLVSAL